MIQSCHFDPRKSDAHHAPPVPPESDGESQEGLDSGTDYHAKEQRLKLEGEAGDEGSDDAEDEDPDKAEVQAEEPSDESETDGSMSDAAGHIANPVVHLGNHVTGMLVNKAKRKLGLESPDVLDHTTKTRRTESSGPGSEGEYEGEDDK
jgi:hypothetical protein